MEGICQVCGGYEDGIGARLAGNSLSLNGNIGVNFYMELDDGVLADSGAYLLFTYANGTTKKVLVQEARVDERDDRHNLGADAFERWQNGKTLRLHRKAICGLSAGTYGGTAGI